MRCHRAVSVTAVLAVVIGAAITTTASPASASTKTFTQSGPVTIGQSAAAAGGGSITIGSTAAATPYPSAAAVADVVGSITDVNLTISGVTGAVPDNFDLMLVSPGGKRAIVMSDAGGSAALAGVDITLDDQAAQDLPDSGAITSGSYRPANYEIGDTFAAPAPESSGTTAALSVFNDSSATGTWNLFVMNDGAAVGSVSGWRLDVKTTGTQPYPSAIAVAGAGSVVTDVNVVVSGFTHTSPADVDMLLVGPRGQQATVLSDAGSDVDANGVTLVLDDGAATPVGSPIVSGSFQPTNLGGADPFPTPSPAATGASTLSVFNGTDPNGTWQLYVVDDAAGDIGAVSGGWSLRITATDTVAPRVATATPTSAKKRVKRTANVTATFTEAVRVRTLSSDTVYLVRARSTTKIKARLSYDASLNRVTLNPRTTLKGATKYRAYVTTRVKDMEGNRLDQNPTAAGRQLKSWSFTTR
jgi:subtilisin-like proprotein convertase family protein